MTIDSSFSLGERLSRWLSIQVFLSFAVVSLVVFFVISNYLSSRQVEGLHERKVQVVHMYEEIEGDDAVNELWHKLNDFLASHHELQIEIHDYNGALLYRGNNQFSPTNQKDDSKLTFTSPLPFDGKPSAVTTIFFDDSADRRLLYWLVLTLVVSSVLAAFAAASGAAWRVRRELESVSILVQQLHQVSVSTLGAQLDGTHQPRELQPIVSQFNELLDRLNRSYHQLENFNADVAHELNTPLTTLITSSELEIQSADKSSGVREILGSNLEELHRMSEIIKSMLFLSRAERGFQPRYQQVSTIAGVVSEVVDYHDAILGDAQLVVSVHGDDQGEFDISLVKRAVSNLLGNSIRYATPSSTITIEISDVDGVYVDISVVNTGAAIAVDAIPRLFDRFYRAEASRSQADKHHGLGLSIVSAIADMHGGAPHASSKSNRTRIGFTMLKKNGTTS